MVVNMYSVYDIKSQIFHPPHYCHNDGHALRMYKMELGKPGMVFAQYPQDFIIYELGSFDDSKGLVKPLKQPRHVINVNALLTPCSDENVVANPDDGESHEA